MTDLDFMQPAYDSIDKWESTGDERHGRDALRHLAAELERHLRDHHRSQSAPAAKEPEPDAGEPSDEELRQVFDYAGYAGPRPPDWDRKSANRALYNLGRSHASRLTEAERAVVEAAVKWTRDAAPDEGYGPDATLLMAVDALAKARGESDVS